MIALDIHLKISKKHLFHETLNLHPFAVFVLGQTFFLPTNDSYCHIIDTEARHH